MEGPWETFKKQIELLSIHKLENGVDPIEEVPAGNANLNGITYGELATSVLQKIIAFTVNSTHIDVVFDVYIDNSIKSAERLNRGKSGSLTIQQAHKDHQIKQWKNFVTDGHNKTEIISLLVQLWSENITLLHVNLRAFLLHLKIYAMKFQERNEYVSELESSQEEASGQSINQSNLFLNNIKLCTYSYKLTK